VEDHAFCSCEPFRDLAAILRSLVKLIEFQKRPIVYSDFEDEIGAGATLEVSGVSVGTDMNRFRAKARQFLTANENHLAIRKLRRNEPLTKTDLSELERIFAEAGVGTAEEIELIRGEGGLGVFVRSLVGLDRAAAKLAFDGFIEGRKLTANQHEFVNMMIEHLTARGVMDPRLLYESPFTDIDPLGVAGVFGEGEVGQLIQILRDAESGLH
jgi:type I restriction enzyme, R subunit